MVIIVRLIVIGVELAYSGRILKLAWYRLLPFLYIGKVFLISMGCIAFVSIFSINLTNANNWVKIIVLAVVFFSSFTYASNMLGYWRVEVLPVNSEVKSLLFHLFRGKRINGWLSS